MRLPALARPATRLLTSLAALATLACGAEPRSRLADSSLPDSLGADALAAGDTTVATPATGVGAGAGSLGSSFAVVYRCPGDADFRFAARRRQPGDSVELFWVENEALVAPVRSGSGARYAGLGTSFRVKGDTAAFERRDQSYTGCAGTPVASVWEEAAALGATFRAVGQEPGWMLLIHPTRGIRYIGQYGEERVLAAPVEPVTDAAGAMTYLATSASGTIGITIEPRACADGMSGEQMTHTVAVSFGGRAVHGCGRMLRPR